MTNNFELEITALIKIIVGGQLTKGEVSYLHNIFSTALVNRLNNLVEQSGKEFAEDFINKQSISEGGKILMRRIVGMYQMKN